jgi:hypothetical protein
LISSDQRSPRKPVPIGEESVNEIRFSALCRNDRYERERHLLENIWWRLLYLIAVQKETIFPHAG